MTAGKMKGASWDSIFLTVVKCITTVTAIAQTKILSVGLNLEEYGTYSQVNIVISLATALTIIGLGDGLNYFFNKVSIDSDISKKRSYVNTIFCLETVIGLLCAIVLIISREMISSFFANAQLRPFLVIIAIKPLLENLLTLYHILFLAIGKAKAIALRNLSVAIVKLLATCISVYLLNDLSTLFITIIVFDVIQYVIYRFMSRKAGHEVKTLQAKRSLVTPILKYSIPMGVFALTNLLMREVDKLVIGGFSGTETLAIYSNCSRLLPFDIIAASFSTVLMPYIMKYISGNMREKSICLFKNYLRIGYYSVWIMAVAVLIVNSQAISFLYSDEYLGGRSIFILYVIDSMIRFASMHLIITAAGHAKLLMRYSIVSLIANVVLNLILYFTLGVIGPAIATVVVAVVYMVVIMRKNLSILDGKASDVIDVKEMACFVGKLILTAVLFSGVNQLLLKSGLNQYIAMIFVMGLFGCTNLALNRRGMLMALREINSLRM